MAQLLSLYFNQNCLDIDYTLL